MRMHDDGLFTSQRTVPPQAESWMGGTPPDGGRIGHAQQSDSHVRDLPQEHTHLWERVTEKTRYECIHTPFPGWNIFRLSGERHLIEQINGRGCVTLNRSQWRRYDLV